MTENRVPDIEFPTDYMFKAFGRAEAGETFRLAVKRAVTVVTTCSDDAIRVRKSSGGKYLCVTVLAHLTAREQLLAIYENLNRIDDLLFLL